MPSRKERKTMKRKSSIIFHSLEARKLSGRYSGYRRFVPPCGSRSRLFAVNWDHRTSLLASLFCAASCATQNLVTNRAFAEEAAPLLDRAESKTAGTMGAEQFASWSFERRSFQLPASSSIGMTGDRGPDVSKPPFASVPTHSVDQLAAYEPALHQLQRARKSANLPVTASS